MKSSNICFPTLSDNKCCLLWQTVALWILGTSRRSFVSTLITKWEFFKMMLCSICPPYVLLQLTPPWMHFLGNLVKYNLEWVGRKVWSRHSSFLSGRKSVGAFRRLLSHLLISIIASLLLRVPFSTAMTLYSFLNWLIHRKGQGARLVKILSPHPFCLISWGLTHLLLLQFEA